MRELFARLIKDKFNKDRKASSMPVELIAAVNKQELDKLKQDMDTACDSIYIQTVRTAIMTKLVQAVLETEKSSTEDLLKNQGRIEAYKLMLRLLPIEKEEGNHYD